MAVKKSTMGSTEGAAVEKKSTAAVRIKWLIVLVD
jgi:hypothetical protein